MYTPEKQPSPAITMILVGVSLLLCLAWIAQLAFVVPEFERRFEEARMAVPVIMEFTIAMSRFVVRHWYVVLPGFVAAFVALGGVSYLLRHVVQ